MQDVELPLTGYTVARERPAIIELSGVDFLGSLGIGMLISVGRALRRRGASLVLVSPQDRVADLLRGARIEELIPIAATVDEALVRLGIEA